MTTEELILAHYDDALTSAQEKSLQELLARSPEARSLFEQHGMLQRMLVSDADVLAPSSRLDNLVIARALATAPEPISSGTAGWFSGKVAAAIAVVVAGGVSVAVLSSGSHTDTAPPAPAERTSPAVAPVQAPATAPAKPAPASAPAVAPVVPRKNVSADRKSGSRSAASESRPAAVKSQRPATKPTLGIDTDATEVQHPLKVDSKGR